MKNKREVEQSYERPVIRTPYDERHPPIPLPLPEGVKLDYEPMAMSDGTSIVAPSAGELIMQRHIAAGFIQDFVLAMRGTETTTLNSIWGALFLVSGALQRRTWQDWVIERLYPNLYIIFIARPGVCKKTVSITFGAKVMSKMRDVFELDEDREIYPLPTWQGGSTPEYLFDLLKPKEVTITADALGFDRPFMIGSRLAIVADELSEFLGRQKYNQGMTSRLTKLYDCPEVTKMGTKKDKTQEVRNVFVNFCGGTTPDSFRDVIPPEAHGGGLMSRCILVWQEHPTRTFYRPQRIAGVPDTDELARRLAWIAENRMGEYRHDKEADALYEQWYTQHKSDLTQISDSDTRADIILVKTAHLIALSRYERSQTITGSDMSAAIELTDLAMSHKRRVEAELLHDTVWGESLHIVTRHIQRRGSTDRGTLMRAVSYRMNADELNKVLTALMQSGRLSIVLGEKTRSAPGISTHEQYIWQYDNVEEYLTNNGENA